MKPYPLAELNHFTVPLAMPVSLRCALECIRAGGRAMQQTIRVLVDDLGRPNSGSLARQTENLLIPNLWSRRGLVNDYMKLRCRPAQFNGPIGALGVCHIN